MANANLNKESVMIDGVDSIVVMRDVADIPGGRTLDVSGVASGTTVLKAGHIIIKDAAGAYKPLGITSNAYDSLSEGESYVGVLKHSILVSQPQAAILTIGQVNAAASPYPVTSTIKSGLPRIEFMY